MAVYPSGKNFDDAFEAAKELVAEGVIALVLPVEQPGGGKYTVLAYVPETCRGKFALRWKEFAGTVKICGQNEEFYWGTVPEGTSLEVSVREGDAFISYVWRWGNSVKFGDLSYGDGDVHQGPRHRYDPNFGY